MGSDRHIYRHEWSAIVRGREEEGARCADTRAAALWAAMGAVHDDVSAGWEEPGVYTVDLYRGAAYCAGAPEPETCSCRGSHADGDPMLTYDERTTAAVRVWLDELDNVQSEEVPRGE